MRPTVLASFSSPTPPQQVGRGGADGGQRGCAGSCPRMPTNISLNLTVRDRSSIKRSRLTDRTLELLVGASQVDQRLAQGLFHFPAVLYLGLKVRVALRRNDVAVAARQTLWNSPPSACL